MNSADNTTVPYAPPRSAAIDGAARGEPHAVLGLTQAVAIIVGIVIGAGIFAAPSMVAGMSGSASTMFAAWVLGGVVSFVGALCYAELASAWPHAGGDYHFLRIAYGPRVSFLFAWARFAVITTGSIALLGFVFGDYLAALLPIGPHGPALYAAAAIVVLGWINLRGIRSGAATQTWLTAVEVCGLLLIVVAGLFLAGNGEPAATPSDALSVGTAPATNFGLAMVFVLLTYGGWNEAAYISAEIRNPKRNIVRALLLSIGLITALYLLVTWAYWRGLGLAGMAQSEALAADLLRAAFGTAGGTLISVLVAVAALTSINATMIVGARTNFALGRDWPLFARLGTWDEARGTPTPALLVQTAMALLLVGIGALSGGGFKSMVEFTAPVFWLFFLLSALSLIVLRVRESNTPRPFKVPVYPLLPLVFAATCAYMLWSSLSYVHSQQLGGWNAAWIGVAVLAVGGLLLLVMRVPAQVQRSAK
jgi:APA family basic amino acid/polyamine antiporter